MSFIGIDLDGTIEDSRADMVAAVHRVRAALELPARSDEDVRPWMSRGMDNLYRNCFDDYTGDADVAARYQADYLEHVVVETKLYDGMREALQALAELAPVVVVTNKPEHISRALLAELDVASFLRDVVGGDTCAQAKPSGVMLEEAARRAGQNERATCVMIGDSNGDVKMARSYGAHAIWCAWGYVESIEQKPDARADRPEELASLARHLLGL